MTASTSGQQPVTHLDGQLHIVQEPEAAGLAAGLDDRLSKVDSTRASQPMVGADRG